MELELLCDSDCPEVARVTKQLKDANGLHIGKANANPLLDTCIYKVEYPDGYKASLAVNTITMNMFNQVDEEGNRHVLFDEIVDHRTYGSEVQLAYQYIKSSNGASRIRETTKGWEIIIRWKDGSTSGINSRIRKSVILSS